MVMRPRITVQYRFLRPIDTFSGSNLRVRHALNRQHRRVRLGMRIQRAAIGGKASNALTALAR
jgi:hypothetical protein